MRSVISVSINEYDDDDESAFWPFKVIEGQ